MKGFSGFKESPAKQKEFIKYNAAGQRVNMMGVPHGTPKSKLTDIGSLKSEHKGLYKQKGSMPKDFNTKGSSWPEKTPGYKDTKIVKAAKHKKSFDKFQSQKLKGKQFVKNLKTGGKQILKKGGKFLGGKTLGILGMMIGTTSKADQPTYKSTGDPRYKKSESQQIKDLLTKHKLKGGRK